MYFFIFFCENVKKIKSQQTVQNLYNNPLRTSLLHERHFGLTFLFLIIPRRKKNKSDRFKTSINQKPQHMHKNIESLNNLNGDSYNHIFLLNPLFVNFFFFLILNLKHNCQVFIFLFKNITIFGNVI